MGLLFSNQKISPSLIITQTNLNVAFINPSPFNNTKHIIVAPKRQVEFLSDLSTEELHDFFSLIHKISQQKESDGLTLNIKDGLAAGSNSSHVHMHIIARNVNDGISHTYVLNPKNLYVDFSGNKKN